MENGRRSQASQDDGKEIEEKNGKLGELKGGETSVYNVFVSRIV